MEGGITGMDIAGLLTNVGTVMTTVFSTIESSDLLSTIVGCGLVGVGAGLFAKFKRSAR